MVQRVNKQRLKDELVAEYPVDYFNRKYDLDAKSIADVFEFVRPFFTEDEFYYINRRRYALKSRESKVRKKQRRLRCLMAMNPVREVVMSKENFLETFKFLFRQW